MTPPRIDHYKAKDGWRWRVWMGTRIVAESGEAYTRKFDCIKAFEKFRKAIAETNE